MAGHSKWAQIKRKKAVADFKKGQLFSALAKAIALEAKRTRGDQSDPGLRAAIEKAHAENFPNENIERAIRSAAGGGGNAEAVLFEAYGPGGVALLIEGATDNKNRTAQEIKHLLAVHGGTLTSPGAVRWAFRQTGSGWQAAHSASAEPAARERVATLLTALGKHPDISRVSTNLCA